MTVNGREISREAVQRKYYFALNKPKGFICRWVGWLSAGATGQALKAAPPGGLTGPGGGSLEMAGGVGSATSGHWFAGRHAGTG